jgi:threonylcarbamoyladenosine tRNA methylthiotransferase CDKAL1
MKTYGCSHNSSDSEYMTGQLTSYGYGITEDFDKADAYLINSCTGLFLLLKKKVKNPSQSAFQFLVEKAKETKKPVIVR